MTYAKEHITILRNNMISQNVEGSFSRSHFYAQYTDPYQVLRFMGSSSSSSFLLFLPFLLYVTIDDHHHGLPEAGIWVKFQTLKFSPC